jgi:hypothetical protein
MSDHMSFNSASTVFVFNLGRPESSEIGTGPGSNTVQLPGPQPAHGGGLIAEKPAKPSKKKARISAIKSKFPESAFALFQESPDVSKRPAEVKVTKPLPIPPCITEKPEPANLLGHPDPLALQVGYYGDIPRWKTGSVIQWGAYTGGYPGGKSDAQYAMGQLAIAASEWNKYNLGVSFKQVYNLEECAFTLAFGGYSTALMARAFFPNSDDISSVLVFGGCFTPDWKPHMWKVFMHELGHVLGLRHEFAQDKDALGKVKEGGSVQWGDRDEYSVMNYRGEPPAVTQKDIDGAKSFYAFTGTQIGGMLIHDHIPDN